jgi:hypothetical protein
MLARMLANLHGLAERRDPALEQVIAGWLTSLGLGLKRTCASVILGNRPGRAR